MSGFRLCHQGHSNSLSSRYCHQCGASLTDAKEMIERVVGDRYRILRDIGHGGFGQTYLAEDSNRFNEPCVLKELAPTAENQDTLEKAKELFAREAEVLYKLQHPQIPRFREWFVEPTRQSMFLVQDYVEGPTYQEILRDRQPQNFSESEVVTLLTQMLPVLSYIHGRGVVHRDLSPDNLICRNSDRLPVLIDFGGVKAGTASISQSAQRAQAEVSKPNITLIGKPGYSPEEQMRQGQVSAASDLYALGVTALVLLTGQEPAELYDSFHLKFDWHDKAQVSPGITAVLDKMVAYKVSDRYTAAVQVLQDIQRPTRALQATTPQAPSQETPLALSPETAGSAKTLIVAPMGTAIASQIVLGTKEPYIQSPTSGPLAAVQKIPGLIWSGTKSLVRAILVILLLLGAGTLGWVAVRGWLQMQQRNFSSPTPVSTQSYSFTEKQRKAQLLRRVEQSSIPSSFFYRLVNEAYYLQYPEQRGQLLGNGPEDESQRTNWDQVALQAVTLTEQLSPSARNRLGSYTPSDHARWRNQRPRTNANARQIEQQAETQLKDVLPMYRDTNAQNPDTLAYQLLSGLIDDRIRKIAGQ